MSTTPRRPGPDSTLDDVRVQLISAGLKLVRERGVDVGLSDISLSDTIAAAGVTRSTAYRSLADDDMAPQAKLHRELLNHLLTRYSRSETIDAIQTQVSTELERQQENLGSTHVERRTLALRSVIRVGANASYQGVIDAPERAILTAIYGSARSTEANDWRRAALAEGEHGLTEVFSELYLGLAGLFQYKLKPEYTIGQFATAGASLVEGIAMRHGINDFTALADRPTGIDGALEQWSLFAIAFEGLFIGMFEPADPGNPFADLIQH